MRTLLHRRESGHLGQYEDEWYFVQEGDDRYVSHEYDYVRVNGLNQNEGKKRIEIDEFMRTGHHTAVTKLKEILG